MVQILQLFCWRVRLLYVCRLWAKNTDSWPAPYTADTSIKAVLGADAATVYGHISMLDGILSKGDDGYSDLLKEGITALLNCVDAHFKYTVDEIKACFSLKTALSSEASAADQAKLFKTANDAYSISPWNVGVHCIALSPRTRHTKLEFLRTYPFPRWEWVDLGTFIWWSWH